MYACVTKSALRNVTQHCRQRSIIIDARKNSPLKLATRTKPAGTPNPDTLNLSTATCGFNLQQWPSKWAECTHQDSQACIMVALHMQVSVC